MEEPADSREPTDEGLQGPKPLEPTLVPRPQPNQMLFIADDSVESIHKAYRNDLEFSSIYKNTHLESLLPLDKHVRFFKGGNGLLYFCDTDWPATSTRLCIPASSRSWVVSGIHDSPHEAAHGGLERMLARLHESFYWTTMCRDALAYCQTCDICQKTKIDCTPQKGFLHPLRIPSQPFKVIMMDYVTGLPESKGRTALLVIVDKLTKLATFIPMTATVTAEETAKLLFRKVFKLYRLPSVGGTIPYNV